MVTETRNSNDNPDFKNTSEGSFSESRKTIYTISIIALCLLIAAVLLISFDQRLFAGIVVIVAASLGIIVIRKSDTLFEKITGSLKEVSSLYDKKNEVITNFSHKIREPLNNLVIMTDMMMESGLQKKQKELLETFIASTSNMVSTVNELTMQSAENVSYEYRKAIKFKLLSTIQNTIELYSLKDSARLEFRLNREESDDLDCLGDPTILKQILLDIFSTIENQDTDRLLTVIITLKKFKDGPEETLVAMEIVTAMGITMIDESSGEQNLSARLIREANGSYTQETINEASVLTITLPFTNPVQETKQKTASSKIEELIQKEKAHKELKDIRILLVEDNIINQKITMLTLKPLVNTIDTASNGKEALDKFGTANYDLILMDIQMPVMSGLVAAEKIRALESTTNSHVPIIAITANAMIGDKEKCLSAGIDDYISKPFQPSALIEKIKKNI